MHPADNDTIKNCMDTLALRIAQTVLDGDAPDPNDSMALMALSLHRLDDEGIAVVMDAEDEDDED